jgi:hypothetical protein
LSEEVMVERMKQALKKAADSIRAMPIALPEKFRAVETLTHARLRLGSVTRKSEDMHTGALLIFSTNKKKEEVRAILDANPPLQMMYQFASVKWVFIQAVFRSAKVECPIELRSFHKAYQEELQTLS